MPPVLLPFALPVILVFLVVELVFSWVERKELYTAKDTLSNICVGLVMLLSNLFLKYLGFWLMTWLYTFRFFEAGHGWFTWVLAFLASDFTFYWYHRTCHEVNWFWASHVVHHSSEKMNISIAFRQSLTTNLSGHFIFWCWMPLLGFSPFIIIIAREMVVFYQFFLHTETVKKLPRWLESVFNTPSHHRVHHSSNPEYLDKNHGGILIIWDKWFGTFCEEKEKPRYGLTHPLETHNPVTIIFHCWKDLLWQAKNAPNWVVALQYFIKAPGWSHDGTSLTVKQQRKKEKNFRKGKKILMRKPGNGDRPILAGAA